MSLIWTKVDEAMLSSSSDDSDLNSDLNDFEDLDEMSPIEVMSHCPAQQRSRKEELDITQPLDMSKEFPSISFV